MSKNKYVYIYMYNKLSISWNVVRVGKHKPKRLKGWCAEIENILPLSLLHNMRNKSHC